MSYSYNQSQSEQRRIRLLFFPNPVMMIGEMLLAVVILLGLNLSDLESRLVVGKYTYSGNNPFSYAMDLIHKGLTNLGNYPGASAVTLFLLWAFIGMLIYLFCFRVIQAALDTSRSLKQGVLYIRSDRGRGLVHWLASLHDLFIKTIIFATGVLLVIAGALLAFTYANLQLHIGFSHGPHAHKASILFGFLSAVVGMRVIVIGLCFSIRPFRRWYFG